ncbi:MAG: aminotransferase, partial [Pseudorhodobacter sp.]|nr:aminotransferase [Pseudorhodobacter sp.]
AILAQNRRQTAAIIDAVDDLGLHLITPRAEAARGGSVMLRLPESRPGAQMVDALRKDGISIDGRGQILRASPGVVTSDEGVSALIASLARHTDR